MYVLNGQDHSTLARFTISDKPESFDVLRKWAQSKGEEWAHRKSDGKEMPSLEDYLEKEYRREGGGTSSFAARFKEATSPTELREKTMKRIAEGEVSNEINSFLAEHGGGEDLSKWARAQKEQYDHWSKASKSGMTLPEWLNLNYRSATMRARNKV